jgi:hypothetical protein
MKMRHRKANTTNEKLAGMSPFRLRAGVALIILWLLPFWALAPEIAHSLSGTSSPPSVASVTTYIVVVQTIFGLLGLWIAGTEVKSIVKGSTLKRSLSALWFIFIHGKLRDPETVGTDPSEGEPPRAAA